MSRQELPLEGVTVLELSHIVAGPFCAMIFGDLGADVIKVENPEGGDMLRDSSDLGNSTFDYLNRNKRSITVNLKHDDGRALFNELVEDADVLLENFGPGATERLGIGYETLAEINDRLIYCSIKGFTPGPYEDFPALDPIAEAMSGLMSVTGREDMPPVRSGTSLADMAASFYAVISVMAALDQRRETGTGQFIQTGLFESSVALMGYWLAYTQISNIVPTPLGASHLNWSPYEVFDTADDEWVFIGPAGQNQWESLCTAIESDDLITDPRFGTLDDRRTHDDELTEILRDRIGELDSSEVIERLRDQGVPVAPVNDVADVLEDPHLKETGMLTTVGATEGGSGEIRVPAYPVKWDGSTAFEASDAPTLGEDTDVLLRELGYAPEAIESLREDGAI